jgi:hypothetical protein
MSIEIGVIEAIEDFFAHTIIELNQIADHAGFGIDGSNYDHLDDVIVAVAMRVIALSVDGSILRFAELVGMQTVRSTERVAASEVGFHGSP